MTCPCGSDWFAEERLVRPAGVPRPLQTVPLSLREGARYRYRCADCGLEYGQEPPKRKTRSPKAN
jgi:hypothetical protein